MPNAENAALRFRRLRHDAEGPNSLNQAGGTFTKYSVK
jgi:hypothetical protein